MKRAQHAISIFAISTTSANNRRSNDWLTGLGLERFVALDLETTGIVAGPDEIIEVGAVLFVNGVPESTYQQFVNPGKRLSPFIVSLTGITDQDLAGAPRFTEIQDQLLEFIGDVPLVGQNVSFDLNFLVESGGAAFRFPGRLILDSAEIARIFWAEFPRFSLAHLCRYFEVSLATAHRAVDDARATGEVLAEMVRRMPDRVWKELADQLAALCGSAHHRSEVFFERLALLSRAIAFVPPADPDTDTIPVLTELEGSELTEGGAFERQIAGFSARPQQLRMAEMVRDAFHDNHVLLLEAPTGTGKSLGYLLPSLEWALGGEDDEQRQVVVSSHTRSLQEQLLHKELADIGRVTNSRVPAAVLKGRENYLCKRRLRAALTDFDGRLSEGDKLKLLPLLRWSYLTKRGDVGEIGGFRPEIESVLWSFVCSDSLACAGGRCGAQRGDFYRLALDHAKTAKLLLVNHALLATDFQRFLAQENGSRRLVIDEAHQFERAVVSAYTETFSFRFLRNTLSQAADERAARGLLLKLAKEIADDDLKRELVLLDSAAKSLMQRARASFQSAVTALGVQPSDESRVRVRPRSFAQEALELALVPLIEELDDYAIRLEKLSAELSREDELPRDTRDRILELRSVSLEVSELVDTGKRVVSADDESYVYWLEFTTPRSTPTVSLFAAPISIAQALASELWKDSAGAVLTSATLAHQDEFHVLRKSLGLTESEASRVVHEILDSPFRLPEQMRCYCPEFLASPQKSEEHLASVAELLSEVITDVRRGCMVLCTSHASAETLANALQPICRRLKRPLYRQASGRDTHELVREFRESSGALLIGSASLWEGIDLVGDALELLVIVKLPFDVPTEPWIEANSELARQRNEDPFYALSIPACAVRLRQGIGRLIRHGNDRGVAIIADSRLATTRYGKIIQKSLPVPLRFAKTCDELIGDIHSFFGTHHVRNT